MKEVVRVLIGDAVSRAVVGFLLLGCLMVTSNSAFGLQSVTLAWDPSSDTNVVGYKVYYGAVQRTYTNVVDVGAATTATIGGLVEGTTYYFAATAYNVLGMESSYSDETAYTVPAVLVNQPPTLSALSDRTLNEDAAQQTVNLSGIGSGSGSEHQTLTVTATSDDTGLIPNPTVTYTSPNTTGTLRFTPVADAFGSTTIRVTVNDGGATNNTITRTFRVTVSAVNDAPTFGAIGNRSLNQNAGQQTVNLSGIDSGAANENQTLTITAISSNTGLIPNPTVVYSSPDTTGTLRFTPVANAHGSATITVTVNDGGSANSTLQRTFTVTVNAAPTITAIAGRMIATNASTGPLSFTIQDAETAAASLTLQAASSAPSLVPVGNILFGGAGMNRTVTITPSSDQSGTATITITVSDGSASTSTTVQVTVLSAPTPPGAPAIVINGQGTITPALDPQTLTMGRTYTITAVPARGQEFTGWTGTYASSNPQLTFLMQSGLVLQANFRPQSLSRTPSVYSGLFFEEDEARLSQSGSFRITTTRNGRYSGMMIVGASRHAVSGRLEQGQAMKTIARRGKTPLTLSFSAAGDWISGYVSNATWVASLAGDRAVFHPRLDPAPFAGRYTLVIPGAEGGASLPAGHGFGVLSVNRKGAARLVSVLADGTRFSQSTVVSRDGQWPMYASLYAGRGMVLSWLNFSNQPGGDLDGALTWIKSALANSRYYPAGFTNQYAALGSSYVCPPAGANVLNATNVQLECSGGNVSGSFTNSLIAGRMRFVDEADRQVAVQFALPSGLYSGRTRNPDTGKLSTFRGAVLQKLNAGYGFLLCTNQSSAVVLAP